jgi:hypothetical protein
VRDDGDDGRRESTNIRAEVSMCSGNALLIPRAYAPFIQKTSFKIFKNWSKNLAFISPHSMSSFIVS